LERVERQGDLFAPVLTLHQQLPQPSELESTTSKRKIAAAARNTHDGNAISRSRRSA
jgi:hypothetical protein